MTVQNPPLVVFPSYEEPRDLLLDNSEDAKLEVSLGTYLRDCLGKSRDQEDVDIYS